MPPRNAKRATTGPKAPTAKARAAKAKEAAEALAAAADNNSDSDSKRPSSGTIDEDSFIDDEAVEDNSKGSDDDADAQNEEYDAEVLPRTPSKRDNKRARAVVQSSPEMDSTKQTPSPRKKVRATTDPKDTPEFKSAMELVQRALNSKSVKMEEEEEEEGDVKKEEEEESSDGDSGLGRSAVPVKKEKGVTIKQEPGTGQKAPNKKPIIDYDPFLDDKGSQMAKRQTPFPKKSAGKGKSKQMVASEDDATDEYDDGEDANAANYEKARKASLVTIAQTNPGDGSTRKYGEEDLKAMALDESQWVLMTTTDGHAFRLPKAILQSMGEIIPDSSKVAPKMLSKPNQSATKPILDKNTVYLEDLEPTSELEPTICQVNNPARQDPLLTYPDNLPRLMVKHFKTWSTMEGNGLVMFSGWQDQCPSMCIEQAKCCVEFVERHNLVNPSRISPTRLKVNTNAPYYIATTKNSATAIMVSAIMVTASNLCDPEIVFGEPQKSIKGILHNEEYQRMESTLCMVARWDTANVQLQRDALTFSTKRVGQSQGGQSSPAKNPSKMFATSSRASAPVSDGFLMKKTALYTNDKIPVLDGRGTKRTFKLGSDLDKLGSKLPEFHNEVPEGSLAWVGYSVNTFKSQKGNNNFSMNLLWVVVLGTPSD